MIVAVIKSGGKQYIAKIGDRLKVEKIKGKKLGVGSRKNDKDQSLEFDDLLAGKKVKAEIIGEGKGKKIRMVKFRAKKRYKRTIGHRQQYTELEIKEIK